MGSKDHIKHYVKKRLNLAEEPFCVTNKYMSLSQFLLLFLSHYSESVSVSISVSSSLYNIAIEHKNNNKEFIIEIKEISNSEKLLRLELQSRHKNSKIYMAYGKYDENEDSYDSIKGYSCNSLSGRRTVGMCTHTTCLIWYLVSGQHRDMNSNTDKYMKSVYSDDETEIETGTDSE